MASGNIIEYIMNLNTKKGTESLKKLAKSTQDALKKLVNIGLKSKISFAQMSKAAKQAGKSISSIKKLMTGLIASIGGAATAIIGFSQKVANSVNEIVDASTRSGIAIDTLAGLRLALEGSGRSFSEVERGLDKFQKRMVTAASGTGEASKHFKALGISVVNADGSFKNVNDTFNEAITKIGQINDQAVQGAALQSLFGRSGSALKQSGVLDDMQLYIDRAKELGPALDENGIRKAADFQRGMADLKTAAIGALSTILMGITGEKGLGAALSSLAEDLANFAGGLVIFLNDVKIGLSQLKKEIETIIKSMMDFLGAQEVKKGIFAVFKANDKAAAEIRKELSKKLKPISSFDHEIKNLESNMKRMKRLVQLFQSGDLERPAIDEYLKRFQMNIKRFEAMKDKPLILPPEPKPPKKPKKPFEFDPSVFLGTSGKDKEPELTEEQKEALKWQEIYNDALEDGEQALKKYGQTAQDLSMDKLSNLNVAFVELVKKVREGNIDFETATEEVKKLKTEFELLGQDTSNLDSLMKKIKNIGRLEKFDVGLNITTDLINAASGDVSGILNTALTGLFTAVAGPAGAAVASSLSSVFSALASFGSQLRDAEAEAIQKEEERLGRKLTKEEKEKVGEEARTEMVKARVEEFGLAIQIALQELPRILIEVLPPLLFELAGRIVTGIAHALYDIPKLIGDWVTKAITSKIPFVGEKRSGGRLLSARSGIRFTGARERQLALLHRNEFVVPESGARPQNIKRIMESSGGSGGINISINADIVERSAIDEIVRKIEQKFQSFGSSKSSLFAG